MKAVIQAGARHKWLMPTISAKPVLELLLHWLRRHNVEAMDREAGELALVLVARRHDLAVSLDSLPFVADTPRRRSLRATSGSPREIVP
ncbi:hypothetical protein ACWIEX_19740 [Bosea sp. NPDC055353]